MIALKVITHSGQEFYVEVESYDPISLNEQINNYDIITLVLGNVIISRLDIKAIFPIDESK
jgi:NADPH-dependent glutamate synthase beta subunit-like oxidoreductase